MTGGGKAVIPYGSINEVMSTKNRCAPPFVPLEVHVIFGKGISNLMAYKDVLISAGKLSGTRGFFNLELEPGKVIKARGESGLLAKIAENIDDVMKVVNSVGGIQLLPENAVVEEDEE